MSEDLKHDEIIAEVREKYTVHHCGQCEFRKSCCNKFDSDECKDTRQSIMLGFGIEDGYFTNLLDRLEAAHKREATCEKSSQVGNNAKTREALEFAVRQLTMAIEDDETGGNLLYLAGCMRVVANKCSAALAEPPRNCDRLDGDINFLREACLRERGLNPEEDFPKVFCEWLLEPAKEEERIKILKILTKAKGETK